MSLAVALAPPIDPTVEFETITWDFGPDLLPGVFVKTIVSTSCTAIQGNDPNATSRLQGSPVIGTAPQPKGSGVINGAVLQFVGGCMPNVVYQLGCVATMSDNQTLQSRGNLPCATPPGT